MATNRKTPHRFRNPMTPMAAVTPSLKSLPINNDEIEKRIRTRENRIRSAVSPGCHTPRSVVRNPVDSRTLESGTSTFSNAQITEHYTTCVKLSTENKINAKNAFGLHLIDYMSEMLRKRGEMTNFQVAGCTLDASAKIYAGRVDSIYNDAYKMLGGLGRSDRQGDGEEGEGEGGETDGPSQTTTKKKTKKSTQVIEKNPKSLDVNTFDLEFEVDPLFKKTSAAFDEGGVSGLLLNQLSVESDNCSLLMNATHKLSLEDKGPPQPYQPLSTEASTEIISFFKAIKQLESLKICKTFANFKFNKDTEIIDDPTQLGNTDYCPPTDQLDYSCLAPPPTTNDYSDDDDDGPPLDNEGDSFVHASDEVAPPSTSVSSPSNREPLKEKNTNTTLFGSNLRGLTDTIEVSEYSYFNPNIMSGWIGGPNHWKLFNLPGHQQNNLATDKDKENERRTIQKKRRRERTVFRVDLTVSPSKDIFTCGKVSIVMSRQLIQKRNAAKELLPHAPKTDHFVLLQLFCKDKIEVHRASRLDDAYQLSDAGDLYNDDSVSEPPLGYDEYDNDTSIPTTVLDDDHVRGGGGGEDPTQMSGSQFMSLLDTNSTTGISLIDEPQKVAHVEIDYAKRAKKIDVKKLKSIMWSTISQHTPPLTEDSPSLSFSSLYSNIKTRGPSSLTNELSVPISFVCLLHLANEKCLSISGREDMSDFTLSQ